ncbi:9560_t:CDS:2 [Ambispora gerdemannii]|uniref:Palmitoyltransferase n=1 Tax=Ambispora gerdemannii TaxID=144530 RepID=A0A9N8W7L1_9GLOM|nr:9560_t:CDS:2 [Ambispora gerdemannii]
MNNQARLSRHASGILPSKQFFAPRKPITHHSSTRRKSTYSIHANVTHSSNSPTEPLPPLLSAMGSTVLSSSMSRMSSEENDEHLPQRSAPTNNTPLTRFSVSATNLLNPNSSYSNYNRASRSLDLQRGDSIKHMSIDNISQAAIDSVLEPANLDDYVESGSSRRIRDSALTIDTISSNRARAMSKIMVAKQLVTNDPATSPYASIAKLFPRVVFQPASLPSEKSQGRKRLYQVWPGRNRFFLGGRIMTSRDFPAFMVAMTALIVPCLLFLTFTQVFYTDMLRTSWSDPGIIPRNLDPSPPVEDLEEAEHLNNHQHHYFPARSIPLPKDVKMNGTALILKYCETCKIYRPPRCSHCRQCDNCVEGEDHHCIWLNNCIGRRNYRSFYTFVCTGTILCLYILGFSIMHLVLLMEEHNISFIESILVAPVSVVLGVIAFLLVWSVGGLTIYHTYLICKNMTTHEQLRAPLARRNGLKNPYDFHSISLNCCWAICRPLTHSNVHRRAFVEQEYLDERELAGSRLTTVPLSPTTKASTPLSSTTTIMPPSPPLNLNSREEQDEIDANVV